jgi:class 3 adenylate cyclase
MKGSREGPLARYASRVPLARAETVPVLTISTKAGTGARDVGRLVAAQLGIDYVDQDILVAAARSLGTSLESVAPHDEATRGVTRRLERVLRSVGEPETAPGLDAPASGLDVLLGRTYGDLGAVETSMQTVAAAVQREQPDLRPQAAPDGTVTLIFTDVEGSTPLNERMGDQRWIEVLREHNAIVRRELRAHGGYEVKSWGDAFMLVFGSARQAVRCAIAIQRAFLAHNESAEHPLRVRIGIHTGEAIPEGGDFYGRDVNLASRIGGAARGSEILASSLVRELTAGAGDIRFGEEREVELKGLAGSHRIVGVDWGVDAISGDLYLSTITSIMRELAAHDDVLIIGRGSQFILKDWPGAVHVLLLAPLEQRIETHAKEKGMSKKEAAEQLAASDKGRAAFHRKFFGVDVDSADFYHLTLNMARVPMEQAADAVCSFVRAIQQSGVGDEP